MINIMQNLISITEDFKTSHTIIKILGLKVKIAKKTYPFVILKENGKKNILLISHELSLTGAPIMLFEMAKMLNAEYNIYVWSASSGALYEYFLDIGIKTSLFRKIFYKNECKYAALMKKFDLVIVNTVVNDFFANVCSKYKIPFIWYIHEAKLAKAIVKNDDLLKEKLCKAEGNILTVSEYAQNFFLSEYGVKTEVLNNFTEDKYTENNFKIGNKLKFLCIGTITPLKGIDYLCSAFVELEKVYKDKIELDIIGDFVDDDYKESLKKICKNTTIINFRGEYSIDKCIEEYEKCNVVIVPSLEESSSRVVLEACMEARPVIVTENVGAKYMVTPDSGWVVKTASVDALKRCIIQILNDTEKIKEMGIKARELYLKTSTKSIYKQNLLAYIKRYL